MPSPMASLTKVARKSLHTVMLPPLGHRASTDKLLEISLVLPCFRRTTRNPRLLEWSCVTEWSWIAMHFPIR